MFSFRRALLASRRTIASSRYSSQSTSSSSSIQQPILLASFAAGIVAGVVIDDYYTSLDDAKKSASPRGTKEVISSMNAPAAIGPYSHAIKANGFLFVSGSIGIDPKTSKLVPGSVAEQTEQALKNLVAIIEDADCKVSNVVKTTVLLNDMADYALVNGIYAKTFSEAKPARAAFACKGLPAGALVEIEAIVACDV